MQFITGWQMTYWRLLLLLVGLSVCFYDLTLSFSLGQSVDDATARVAQ